VSSSSGPMRVGRRRFLEGAVLAPALSLASRSLVAAESGDIDDARKPRFADRPPLVPIDARPDRIVDLNVCTRPFRAAGPRIEAERIAGKTVIHNYGHGGSGWSLSWGSAAEAIRLVPAPVGTRVAVVGCGAIGLTSALTAQRAGFKVRIYARERPPDVRSSGASGVWSPDSRICTADGATPAFERRWEAMARFSFHRYQSLLGLPGDPVEWRDGYVLSDVPFDQFVPQEGGEPRYPNLEERLLVDLHPRSQPLSAAEHPFRVAFVRRFTQMVFNISGYSRLLVDDFLRGGGEIVTHEFASPREFRALRESTIVNATGYGARALLGDESIVPVRGQTARLVPQRDVNYGIYYRGHNLSVVPRRDGILVQAQAEGDFGNPDTRPDRQASDDAVGRLAALFETKRG
jgi:glycine/D-amino acid oxidase-like deaminating enzyme